MIFQYRYIWIGMVFIPYLDWNKYIQMVSNVPIWKKLLCLGLFANQCLLRNDCTVLDLAFGFLDPLPYGFLSSSSSFSSCWLQTLQLSIITPSSFNIALWAKLLRKWEIGKFNKITSWPLIFWKTLLFQMNLEENVTFTFYFFSFASNFPCKILWDNKNIDANIFIFSNSIFTMKGVRSKKVILRFFLKHKKI